MNPWCYLKRGNALIKLNRWGEAREEYEMAERLDPGGQAGKLARERIEKIDR